MGGVDVVTETRVIWTPDKTLSPAERARLLRILFGPHVHQGSWEKSRRSVKSQVYDHN